MWRVACALRHQVRDHHGHARRGRRQRHRQRDRPGARAAARERGSRRALPQRHDRHLQHRLGRLLLQHERAADPVLLGQRDAPADHADHPHDPARRVHRLHAFAERRARQPPAGRPLHLGRRQGRRRSGDVPGAADGPERRQHLAGQEDLLRWLDHRHRRHHDRRRLHHRLPPRGDQRGHGRGRVDRLRLALQVAGRQRPGPARGHVQDVGPGRRRRARAPTRRRAA